MAQEGRRIETVPSDARLFRRFGGRPVASGKDENGCPTLSDVFGLFSKESDAVELLPCHRDKPHSERGLILGSGHTPEGARP